MEKTLGQIQDELFEVVRGLHIAYMGDDRSEINFAEKEYELAKETYGSEMVQLVQDYYNTEIIGKAK